MSGSRTGWPSRGAQLTPQRCELSPGKETASVGMENAFVLHGWAEKGSSSEPQPGMGAGLGCSGIPECR